MDAVLLSATPPLELVAGQVRVRVKSAKEQTWQEAAACKRINNLGAMGRRARPRTSMSMYCFLGAAGLAPLVACNHQLHNDAGNGHDDGA